MLLLVDDRTADQRLVPIKEHLMNSAFSEMFSFLLGDKDLTILAYSGNDLRLIRGGPHGTSNTVLNPAEGLLHLLEMDADDVCVIMDRIAFFSEGFSDIFRFHRSSGSDVTVLVKELPALPGMFGVSLDRDLDLSYRKREDPVRSKSMDLNIYVVNKNLLKEIIHSEIDVKGLDVRSLPLLKDDLKMKGYRLRSKVGFTDDIVSLLETQRMVMDTYLSHIEKVTSRNIDISSEQILNMPVYISNRVKIGSKCRIGPYASILDDVIIGNDVFIINSIIGKRCVIGDDSYIEGSVIGPDNTVEKGSEVEWNIR
jgi:glucose-1-phosphate adenylyltransferase